MPGIVLGGILALAIILWICRGKLWPALRVRLLRTAAAVDAVPLQHVGIMIAVAAGAGLYAELMMIRIQSSYFHLFSYFKNVSLMSCFLGLGVGYTLRRWRPLGLSLIMPCLVVQLMLLGALRLSMVKDTLQNPITEVVGMGITQAATISHMCTVYGFLVVIFILNACCFIPLGHIAARHMERLSPLKAYSWNLIGSLVSIGLFNLLAYLWTPPSVWIVVLMVMLLVLMRCRVFGSVCAVGSVAILLLFMAVVAGKQSTEKVYSPYQVLELTRLDGGFLHLFVNNMYFQRILDLRPETMKDNETVRRWANHYNFPYVVKPNPATVLVVGSGTGNDVAAALRHGAGAVDAVEIDPVIIDFGISQHPEKPYTSDRVTVTVEDARAFIRRTTNRYDLIVYGLLDSHTLLSSQTSVRLDSFVYTTEAFREARSKLTDDGVLSITFSMMNQELARKIFLMLESAFDGRQPMVYQTTYDGGVIYLAGPGASNLPESVELDGIFPATFFFRDFEKYSEVDVEIATDDWPFLYMPERQYPWSYVVMIVLLVGISGLFVRELMPGARQGFSWPCFFLGAGFMLVETKAITELALAYGSTWVVIGIVIAAILLLAFLANLLVIKLRLIRPVVCYGGIAVALIVGMAFAPAMLKIFPSGIGNLMFTLLITLPLFFSGLAFSNELKCTASVSVALSSNLLGAMVGGFLEYNALYFGYQFLYVLALVMYLCAGISAIRKKQ